MCEFQRVYICDKKYLCLKTLLMSKKSKLITEKKKIPPPPKQNHNQMVILCLALTSVVNRHSVSGLHSGPQNIHPRRQH